VLISAQQCALGLVLEEAAAAAAVYATSNLHIEQLQGFAAAAHLSC
jgi:hypothetical protein